MITDFKNALDVAGLFTKEKIMADGRLHRFHVEGEKHGSKNGWYVIFTDGRPAGVFGSWKTGQRETWSEDGRRFSEAERIALNEQMKRAQIQAKKEKRFADEKAALAAQKLWDVSLPAIGAHPYLQNKRVKAHGLRQSRDALIVPLCDIYGKLWNVQRIFPDGKKLFCSGRAKGLFSSIGSIKNPVDLIICEGWATGATLHEETGKSVLCAMNAGNLLSVSKAAYAQWPKAVFIVAADNDRNTAGNPGLTKAREVSKSIGAKLAVPDFPKGAKGTDFNDLALLRNGGR